MTHCNGTTVSRRKFSGFGNKDVYKAFIRCQTIKFWISGILKSENDSSNFGLNEKTHILRMIEDFDDAELKNKVILEISEAHSSSVLSKEISHNGLCKNMNEVYINPLTSFTNVKPKQEELLSDCGNILKCEKSSPSEDSDLLSNSQIKKTNSVGMGSHLDAAEVKRGPSPLLFTPVKGENTYGAGYLTQNTNSEATPTNSRMGSTSKNPLPPLLNTPTPKSQKDIVLSSVPGDNILPAGKGLKNSQHCESQFNLNVCEMPSGSANEESQKVGSYPHLSSSTSNLNKETTAFSRTVTNAKHSYSFITFSPHVEKLPNDSNPSSPDHLPSKKCVLEPQLKSSPSKCIRRNQESTVTPLASSPSQLRVCDSSLHSTSKKEEKIKPLIHPYPPKPLCDPLHPKTKRKHRLRTLLSRVRHSLSGLPPPPSVTIPQMSVPDMLEKLLRSEVTGVALSSLVEAHENSTNLGNDTIASLFHPSATEDEIREMTWPSVLDCVHLGVCYNLGCSSEALEDLCQQVREKYVGNETASSCTVWSMASSTQESSSKQRRNGTFQPSNVVRESYMTRRRRAFSLASLTATIPSIASKSRQILVNSVLKKPKEAKKPQAKHRREYDGSRVTKKEDSKLSLSKRCFGDKGKNLSKLNSIKRSLSFNDSSINPAQSSSIALSEPSSSSLQAASSLLISTKRVLKFDSMTKGATSSSLDVCSTQSKIVASRSSPRLPGNGDAALVDDDQDCRKNQYLCSTVAKELGEVHKKKLLWAVAQALRSRGLGTGHQQFKVCAIPLFRHCREEYLTLSNIGTETCVKSGSSNTTLDDSFSDSKSVGSADSRKESTSDKMLSIALGLVDKVMNEAGVAPVVKERGAPT